MLDGAECPHRRGDRLVATPGARRRDRRRQHVLDVVPAADRDLARRHEELAVEHQFVGAEVRARASPSGGC